MTSFRGVRVRHVVIAAMLVTLACGSEAANPDRPVVTIDSTGSVPVMTVTGDAPGWALDSVAALTDTGGQPFSRLRGMLLDGTGAWVIDEGEQAIHRFGAMWSHLGVAGRVGSGPGEYQSPYALGRVDDALMLYDPGAGRVSLLDTTFQWQAQWPVGRLTGGSDIKFYPGGWLMQYARRDSSGMLNFTRFTRSGPTDTLWFPPNPERASGNFVECQVGGGIRFFGTPFGAPSLLVPTPDGEMYMLRGADYRFVRLSRSGDSSMVFVRPVDHAPITDSAWAAGTADWTEFQAAGKASSCKGSLDRPAHKPAVRSLVVDDRGRLWVERIVASGFEWDIWDHGRLVGSLTGPARDADVPVEVGDGHLGVARELPDGGQVVVIYRVREAN